jgi:hypothetical protein
VAIDAKGGEKKLAEVGEKKLKLGMSYSGGAHVDIETLHMHVYYLNFLSYAFVELCLMFEDKCLVIFCGSNYVC